MAAMPNEDIHPELRRAARFIPNFTIRPWALPLVRTLTNLRKPSDTGIDVLTLPSGAGVRLHRPANAADPTPALLWIHGGGYLFGTAAQDDDVCRQYAERLGITVAAVDYRLAPEHPYPIPLEDCYSVLTWLARLPGIDSERIAIGGASAGGGLTAALAFLARDRAEVRPVLQVLSYPMLDDRSVDPSLDDSGFRLWNTSSNRIGWQSYLGGADPMNPIASPLFGDWDGAPPLLILVGDAEVLLDDSRKLAEVAKAAGVDVTLSVYPDMPHIWTMSYPAFPEAVEGVTEMAEFVARVTA